MKRMVTMLAGMMLAAPANAAPLTFNGVSGRSNLAAVQAKFATAKAARMPSCKSGQETQRFADGVSRCDYLRVPAYKIGGYDFYLAFMFSEDGGLKTAALTWPSPVSDEKLEPLVIENAYHALVDLYVSKYGKYVAKPPCSFIGQKCQEWQIDGTSEWHAGGERIEMRYDGVVKSFTEVTIKYEFSNSASFDRF